jgi:hypothetical protein
MEDDCNKWCEWCGVASGRARLEQREPDHRTTGRAGACGRQGRRSETAPLGAPHMPGYEEVEEQNVERDPQRQGARPARV